MTEPKTLVKLNPGLNRMNLVEYRRQEWLCTPESGTKVEWLFQPEYWSHISGRMKPLDKIDVLFEDGSLFLTLMVVSCSRIHAKVIELYRKDLTAESVNEAPDNSRGFESRWMGPNGKWSVIRTSDKTTLKSGLASRAEADAWSADYEKSIAA